MLRTTLCFLIRKNEICLAMKRHGFGKGKWNGVGGKVDEGETIEKAAIRELYEEVGVSVEGRDLRSAGSATFYFDK